ncbi:MAG: ATP-dependent DNA helicase RecG [Flavobacteriales bacterium]|nr:ATP-dependent DNA helicase RecG [Flavobacteriales bacterium]MDG1440109.1 ATP-dependent DNA helicase RecG [Flavobacteriales bacterium]
MINSLLHTSIEYLKGVGPKRADVLKSELNIFRYRDLLNHFPFRYVDRTQTILIKNILESTDNVQLLVKIIDVKELGQPRKKRLVVTASDESGSIQLVWFRGVKWLKSAVKVGEYYVVFGKPTVYGNRINFNHPEIELEEKNKNKAGSLQPVYHSTEKLAAFGLHSKGLENLMRNLLPQVMNVIPLTLSKRIEQKNNFPNVNSAYSNIHFPQDKIALQKSILRLKYEELFFLQLGMTRQKINTRKKSKGYIFNKVGNNFNDFFNNHLPFELTNAQKRVVKEIRKDLGSGMHMNRLLQGDVGSGKTLVAVLTILLAIDNGFQACLMAPTEILANQHFKTILNFLKPLGIKISLLTGSVKKADRKVIHESLENGSLNILVGTHALIEDKVKFKNLGISIIDEQHRFGVAQRAKLWKKNNFPPHVLVMTATPIPRTLAMTFYGDLEVSVIDELPPGRKPINTIHRFDSSRLKVFQFIEDEIKKGHQVYIVYPLIEESEKLDYKDLMDGYESIVRRFPLPHYKVSIVHGKMKPEAKDYEMSQFVKGQTQIMVATTVIEVGVDVPNASLMIIESAEKFGLSQLHQLRGRVGRGAEKSYCILMSGYKLSKEAKIRLETMVRTNDGFEISEQDLKIRGPGDVMGTQQSGVLDFKLANLARDGQLVQLAKIDVDELLNMDPHLSSSDNQSINTELLRQIKLKPNWSNIS